MTSRQFGGWKQVTTLRPSPGTVIHNACRSVVFFNTRGGPEDPPPPMTGFLSPTILSIVSCMNPYKHSPFKSPRNDGKDVYSIRIFFSLLVYNLICINWLVGLSSPSGSARPIPASRLLFRDFTLARQKGNFPSETKKRNYRDLISSRKLFSLFDRQNEK